MPDVTYKRDTITQDGEVIGQSIKKFYNPFKDGKGYNFKYKSTTIKSYLGVELPKEFNDSECGKLYRLSKLIYSDSNLLAKRTCNIIKPMSKADVQEIFQMHRNKFNPLWKKILEHNIMKPIEINGDKYFCFNPLYYNTTHYLPLYLFIAFQKELNEHLPKWVVTKYLDMAEELGIKEGVAQ